MTAQLKLIPIKGYQKDAERVAAWLEENAGTRIRLLGVGGSRLSPAEQRDLFGP